MIINYGLRFAFCFDTINCVDEPIIRKKKAERTEVIPKWLEDSPTFDKQHIETQSDFHWKSCSFCKKQGKAPIREERKRKMIENRKDKESNKKNHSDWNLKWAD